MQKKIYDITAHDLLPFETGDSVCIEPPKDKRAAPWREEVVEERLRNRAYKVRTYESFLLRRKAAAEKNMAS